MFITYADGVKKPENFELHIKNGVPLMAAGTAQALDVLEARVGWRVSHFDRVNIERPLPEEAASALARHIRRLLTEAPDQIPGYCTIITHEPSFDLIVDLLVTNSCDVQKLRYEVSSWSDGRVRANLVAMGHAINPRMGATR